MQNIFIVFLAKADRATLNFEGIEKDIKKNFGGNAIYSTDLAEIDAFLQNYNTDTQPLIVTVLTHGAPEGISTEQSKNNWIRLNYTQLLPLIARCRTVHPVILNLTAPCKSYLVTDYIDRYLIDEAWFTTGESDSLHNGLTAAKQGYDRIKYMDEKGLYRKYVRKP